MNIYLFGYMGSGKSTVGPLLAQQLNYDFIDFDAYISEREERSISEIFEQKGEIYFRKKEGLYLQELLATAKEKHVIALGGGTPCYGNNLELLKQADIFTIYLNVPFKELTKRLWDAREDRPLIAAKGSYELLEDFVRKHLFERGYYYNQAQYNLKVGTQTAAELVEEIVLQLF